MNNVARQLDAQGLACKLSLQGNRNNSNQETSMTSLPVMPSLLGADMARRSLGLPAAAATSVYFFLHAPGRCSGAQDC